MTIHVAITRKVLPGKEVEFKEALRKFLGESFAHDGVQGASMLTSWPDENSRVIGILRTFANESERDAFYSSQLYKDWEAYAAPLTEGEVIHRPLHGLEAWFRAPGAPPRWKMAVVTLIGVYPTSLFLALTIGDLIHPLPVVIKSFIMAAAMVGLLTWVVMPQVIKFLKGWLHSQK